MTAFGCERCFGEDAARAWKASQATRTHTFVQESHFSVHVTACDCGQRFVTVFMERLDWNGGEDDQTWLVLPVREDEARQLDATAPDDVPRAVTAMGAGRRFLVRSFPTGGALSAWWRESGFGIGPHD